MKSKWWGLGVIHQLQLGIKLQFYTRLCKSWFDSHHTNFMWGYMCNHKFIWMDVNLWYSAKQYLSNKGPNGSKAPTINWQVMTEPSK